jgi:indolepyruvate ferredoxin oxidoreductase beta subunit
MKLDILVAGVGGQGILSVAAIIARAALVRGGHVKQSELHGMAQRGGAVYAHLRISDREIHSDLIPRGAADLVLSLEALEALRYTEYLDPEGSLIASTEMIRNFPGYPDPLELLRRLETRERTWLVDAPGLARKAGFRTATNMVLLGTASRFLPISSRSLSDQIRKTFAGKGTRIVDANLDAYRLGREVLPCIPA